jgi:apolipoprotein N-acyltransferase
MAVIFGAELPAGDGLKYDNAAVMLQKGEITASFQRIPVPYSMYRGPFAKTGANLHLFDDGVISLPDGRRSAVVICYEAFLSWPILRSMWSEPDVIIVVSNLWWCRQTSLPSTMERTITLWGKLFGKQTVFSKNL